MNPFELLKKDHEKVSKLFKQIEEASGSSKLTPFKKAKKELELHTYIEETIFYPALKNAKETRDITLEAYEEHKVVKDLLAELDSATNPSDQWTAKFTVLKENVEHHVEEEEGELFKNAKDVLTSEQAEALGDQMAAEKERQGATVPEELKKPGLIKTVVNALFGPTSKKAGRKKTATKSIRAKSSKRRSAKKSVSKKTTKTAGRKASKTAAIATQKPTRKRASKKALSRAKAA